MQARRPSIRQYYDEFAAQYERERQQGYHAFVDDREAELIARYGAGKRVLEVGCGTGLILERAARVAASAFGIDLSSKMLRRAVEKRLSISQASVTALPLPSNHFDLVCSFKVLAHVEDIERALAELVRVTRPGGHLLLEFYNAWSLRYLIKRVRPPLAISAGLCDDAVYTRYDTLAQIEKLLPPSVQRISLRGIRIFTAFPQLMKLPGVGPVLERIESLSSDAPILRRLGGFLVVVARKCA